MADKLTASAVREIANLSKNGGKQKLAKYLEMDIMDEELDMRKSIHVDFLYDNLMFAAEKGLPWEHICLVVVFADNLLTFSLGKDLIEVLKYVQSNSTDLGCQLGERNFKIHMDFLFSTFLQHFKLFQYVFLNEREKKTPYVQLEVAPPKESAPMKQAKEVKIWEYQQNYEALERKEAERQNERLIQKEKLEDDSEKRVQETIKNIEEKKGEKFTKETITDILKEVIGTYAASTLEKLKWNIEETKEDLEFKLQKTSLPRPQTLGAPPRYTLKPKTPATAAKPKTPKSPQAERKKSGSGRSRGKAK